MIGVCTVKSKPLVEVMDFQVLMRTDKGANNFSDRSLVKNLGHWLGLLTLPKNKPILHEVSTNVEVYFSFIAFDVRSRRALDAWQMSLLFVTNRFLYHSQDLDIKSLIYEAYYKGVDELMFVVPFVAKVMESCQKSKVSRP